MNKRKKYIIFSILGILYILIVLKYNTGIPCAFHKITGLYCPGCGGTRAVISLIKLDLYQAIRYNALIVCITPIAVMYSIIKFGMKKNIKIPNWIWIIILMVVLLFTILRNIPLFSFLAPTEII